MHRLLLTTAATAAALLLTASPAHAAWLWPVRGDVITPFRNGGDPYAAGQHRGIDIAAGVGTPVVAAAGGEVRFAGTAGSSGMTVSVRTGDGYDTSYLHLSSLAVRAGARVAAGERLGAVGTTGERSASAPHLHFGVREAGTRHAYIDPLSFLPPPAPPPREAPGPAPEPAPAPGPAPLAPRPAPAPAPAPGGAPRAAPVPGRAPRPAPGRAPRPVPGGLPRSAPGRAPRSAPGRAPRSAPGRAPHQAPGRLPRSAPGHAPRSAPGGAPRSAPGRAPRLAPMPSHPPRSASAHGRAAGGAPTSSRGPRSALSIPAPRAAPPSAGGPDIGWALACAGLLLAAGVLGLTDDGRKAAARSRSRLAGVLRPLLGRR